MKILFAISNENVLNRIVDSYKSKYGETVSFKNVFYFNAIIREIQKDKTYDRIVISEDLEPFSNNNYDIIDRFIIERLQEISNESKNSVNKKIEMIVICTDRRTKSSLVLSKLFEFGIYNALVGTDRRIDNVCDLIKNPRTEIEALQYYKLEEASNAKNTIDDVSEEEVQNIIIHYQKLGKNEDRYVDSFNNIAAQYTDNQLRVIIKCLPIHVKAVLEAECPKYQELVTYVGGETAQEKKQKEKIQEQRKLEQIEQKRKLKEKIERNKKEALKKAQGANTSDIIETGIDILDNKHNQTRMTGNVIIPNNMNIKNERKIYSDDELNKIQNTPRNERMGNIEQPRNEQLVEEQVKTEKPIANEDLLSGFEEYIEDTPNANSEITLPGLEEFDDIVESSNDQSAELPGFEDFSNVDATLPGLEDIQLPQSPDRPAQLQIEELPNLEEEATTQQKRGRGRPRKYPIEPPKPKGKRGRPRKNPLPEEQLDAQTISQPVINSSENIEQIQTLPGLEEFNNILDETQNDISQNISNNTFENQNILDSTLPGMDEFEDIDTSTDNSLYDNITLPGLEDESNNEDEDNLLTSLPGLEDNNQIETMQLNAPDEQFIGNTSQDTTTTQNYSNQYIEESNRPINTYSQSEDRIESIRKLEENKIYSTGSLNTVLTKDKKIVAFVGASKSGTSFLVNNLACLFSSLGVKTAILDMTKNRNSYYIYTNNEENLRNTASTSIEKLESGIAEGIKINRNLEVYTAVPNDGKNYSNAETILSTLVQNASLVLIDCDFETDFGYFTNAQEIYLVQSMDILTIQPLTGFLRDLKTKGILEQEKLRIVVNKELKVRNLSSKAVIGGMSFYNDPAMSYMTELFSKDKIKACTIPFDENVYSRYLEAMVNCAISINGYPKGFMNSLKILGNMVYPLLSKQTYTSKTSQEMNYGNNFSTEMNNTLNQMRNKY